MTRFTHFTRFTHSMNLLKKIFLLIIALSCINISFAAIPLEYKANYRINTQRNEILELFVKIEASRKVNQDIPPQLFDLEEDPQELNDCGRDAGSACKAMRDEHYQLMFDWMRARRNRIGMTDEAVARRSSPAEAGGVKIGQW